MTLDIFFHFLFHSEIVPAYDSMDFVISEFSRLRLKGDPVYSEPLLVNGLSWRLKVYPVSGSLLRNESAGIKYVHFLSDGYLLLVTFFQEECTGF